MPPPIRILELRSVRGTGGGPEKTILHGAALADRSRFAVTVCYIRDARDRIYAIDRSASDLDVDFVEVWERHSFDPGIWPQLTRLIRERSIQIVHAHEYKTDLVSLLLSRSLPVVPLATVHGWTGHSKREQIYYWADKKVLARFPRLIAVSSDIKRELEAYGSPPERITTILNGIDHRRFVRVPASVKPAREALGIGDGDISLGAVGRLEPQKHFGLLIDVFARLRAGNPRLRLTIVGEGSARGALEAQIRQRGLGDSVRLAGHLSDVRPAYHAFDLYVQSSIYEGTPNSVLEAMALETPVIATRAGGTEELIRDGVQGWLVPVNDAKALAQALTDAIEHPEQAREYAVAARWRVEHELSFEKRTAAVEHIYESLVAP